MVIGMRCVRCGKNFDEEMYSGVCPKCGHFNNRRAEVDVSGYFSAKFDDDKVSTDAQASAQHARLHEMYDDPNAHKAGAGQHEKLHGMYDNSDPHRSRQSKGNGGKKDSYRQGRNENRDSGDGQINVGRVIFRTLMVFVIALIVLFSIATGNVRTVAVALAVWFIIFHKSSRRK